MTQDPAEVSQSVKGLKVLVVPIFVQAVAPPEERADVVCYIVSGHRDHGSTSASNLLSSANTAAAPSRKAGREGRLLRNKVVNHPL